MAEDRAARRQDFIQKTQILAYQTAFQRLKSDEDAEKCLIEAYERVFMNPSVMTERSFSDQKVILCLIVDYLAMGMEKKAASEKNRFMKVPFPEEDKEEEEKEDGEEEEDENLLSNKMVNEYYKALTRLRDRDKIFLYLSRYYLLKNEEIASLIYMRKGAVSRRLERIEYGLNRMVKDNKADLALRSEAVERAIHLFLKDRSNEIEALSNLGSKTFSPQYETSISDLVRASKIQMDIRRLKHDESSKSRKGAYYASGVLAVVLIIFLLRISIFSPKVAKNQLSPENSVEISRQKEASEAIERQISIKKENYAAYDSEIVFYDKESGNIFSLPKGGKVKLVANIAEEAKKHAGVQYIGKQKDTLYLAFFDGRGGKIKGASSGPEISKYWQELWFKGKAERPEAPKDKIVYDGTEYLLEDL